MQSQFQAQSQGTWPDGSVVTVYNLDYLIVAGGGGGAGAGLGGGELVDIDQLDMDLVL